MQCVKCKGKGPFIRCYDKSYRKAVYICLRCFGKQRKEDNLVVKEQEASI